MSMIIVTGGAGLIGSALVWALNKRGRTDLLVVDDVDHLEKKRNLQPLKYEKQVGIKEFREELLGGRVKAEAILHMGAISSTFEKNWERLQDLNVSYTQAVIQWAVKNTIRCVYASSAATYGDGVNGYSDDHALFDKLQPLNLYGKSKLAVDMWARDNGYLEDAVGLRYFNVFGPNEYHKGEMRSVVTKKFDELQQHGFIELFKSNDPQYEDGQQPRDFVYVKDAVEATLFFLDKPKLGGVYNIGTGKAETWNTVARAMFTAVGKPADIRYISLPAALAPQYQNFTQADITKLTAAGYSRPFMPVAAAVTDYIQHYLTIRQAQGKPTDRHDHRHLAE